MSATPTVPVPATPLYGALLARLLAAPAGGAAEGPTWPSPPAFPPPDAGRFGGLAADAFAFFAALGAENTREWFQAHADVYRRAVDRPWRALLGILAAPLRDWLPDLDTDLRIGHVCSRINRQWPRRGAVYHTGLRAVFAPQGAPRPAAAALAVAIDASGVRAGAEVRAGTAAWSAACRAADDPAWVRLAAGPGLAWALGDHPVAPAEVALHMRGAGRRAILRLGSAWDPGAASALGPGLAEAVRDALWRALPLYVAAMGAAAREADAPGGPRPDGHPGGAREQSAPVPATACGGDQGTDAAAGAASGLEPRLGRKADALPDERPGLGQAASAPAAPARSARRPVGSLARRGRMPSPAGGRPLPRLPAALRRTLRDMAAAEGVSLEALVVFALTRYATRGPE